MEVRLADCAGFCFGVKRAVDTVFEQLKNGKTIYTYGPIVHNEEVVRELAEKGVKVLESKEELKNLTRDYGRQVHVEVLEKASGPEYVMFDYRKRDPLTGEAWMEVLGGAGERHDG